MSDSSSPSYCRCAHAPVHLIARTVFALPREKQAAWLVDHKQYVIDRLNADFQKPWFAAKKDGTTCDLADMTYSEVIARLVRLMFVAHERRWIDPSLRNLVGDWIRRVEERLSNVNSGSLKVSALQSYEELNEPDTFIGKFNKAYPEAEVTVLASADVAYFLAITQRPGQKVSLVFTMPLILLVSDRSLAVSMICSPCLSFPSSTDPSPSGSRRTRCGRPRTSRPCSTRTRNECASCRAPSRSSTARRRSSRSGSCWTTSTSR